MLAMEFFVHGATQFGEPDVFMMFEENAAELTANVRSLGFDLEKLVAQKKIVLDHVHIERSEIEKTDEYDLEGLFIRLWHSIESIGTNEYPSSSARAASRCCRSLRRGAITKPSTERVSIDESGAYLSHAFATAVRWV